MKNIINNILLLIAITLVTLLSGYFIYQSYTAYRGYQIAQNADEYISSIKNANKVLQKVEDECAMSALYLGNKGKIDFVKIETSREHTDNAIKNANHFILNNPKFLSNLQYVRSRVDIVSSDYKDIFFTYYQDEISNTLLKEIKNNIQVLAKGLSGLKKELYTLGDFITYRNNINSEKSFIAYILTLSKKMNNNDLQLWENILARGNFPILDNLNDPKIVSDIQTIFQPKEFLELNFRARVAVTRGITNGNYQITPQQWFENRDLKIKRIIQSEEKLDNNIQVQITNETSYPKALLYNSAISLFLILTLYLLIHLQKNSSNQIKLDRSRRKRKKEQNDYDRTNLPLTNLSLDDEIPFDTKVDIPHKTELNQDFTFNPMEKFVAFTKEFIDHASEKNIEISYYIDPTIPTYCVGDFIKINQALSYLSDYIIDASASRSTIIFRIDNIAQNAHESAIRFAIREHKSHFTKEEKRIIHSVNYSHIQEELSKTKLSGIKANLLRTSKLISSINGGFKIEENPKKGTDYFMIVNLKK